MHIDYARLVWDDMVYPARQFVSKKSYKVSFVRYTKLLISHFMAEDAKIDKRLDDKYHSEDMDHILSKVRIHGTNTTNKGKIILDFLLSETVKATEVYKTYDAAKITGLVGITEPSKKSTRSGRGRGRGKKAGSSGRVTRATKKKTTQRDEELSKEE